MKTFQLLWRILILFTLAFVLIGCPPSAPRTEPVDVPANVFSLQDEVIAVRTSGSGEVEIDLEPLRNKAGDFDDLLVLEYVNGIVQREVPYTTRDRNIVANLSEGNIYLIFVRPKERIHDIYSVLCRFDFFRDEVEMIEPGLIDRICTMVLCTPDQLMGSDIFARFPQIQSLQNDIDVNNLRIGGWGSPVPSNICDRCTSFKTPNLIYPVDRCWGTGRPLAAKVINMIPNSLSGETNQDSEPFLAVDRTSTNVMAGTAFTPNPFGTSGNAPIYVSTDNGDTWFLNMIVPSNGSVGTGDITVATTQAARRLYGGILRIPGNLLLNVLRTNDFTSGTTMAVLRSRTQVDQPFVQATTMGGNDRIYVGNNDFNVTTGRTATVDVSVDGGTTFNAVRIETRNTSGQNGPSIRPTVSGDGTVYAAYFGWRNFTGSIATSDVVVVRDDNGATGANPFRNLTDPSDNQSGRIVAQGVTIPWSNAPTLGFERIGSTLSISVHPTNSSVVYICWADRVGNGDIYTLHVRRSTDRGATWTGDLRTITNATCGAVAVASNGTVGFLYQQFTGSGTTSRWVTHLEQSPDGFATITDNVLASVPGNAPARQFLPYIGDYNFLLSVGNEFRGIFSANNTPDMGNFPSGVRYQRNANFSTKTLTDGSGNTVAISIDPFYFSVRVK